MSDLVKETVNIRVVMWRVKNPYPLSALAEDIGRGVAKYMRTQPITSEVSWKTESEVTK